MYPNRPNYYGARLMRRKPLTYFGILFSFLLPPLGFLLDLIGLLRDKHNGLRFIGWIFLMIVSIVMSILFVVIFANGIE